MTTPPSSGQIRHSKRCFLGTRKVRLQNVSTKIVLRLLFAQTTQKYHMCHLILKCRGNLSEFPNYVLDWSKYTAAKACLHVLFKTLTLRLDFRDCFYFPPCLFNVSRTHTRPWPNKQTHTHRTTQNTGLDRSI